MTALFFAVDTEPTCAADLHRSSRPPEAGIHLPSAVANELTETGWPQEALPVVRHQGARLVIGQAATERAERNAKWKAANRPEYLAGKLAWYHRWKARNPALALTSVSATRAKSPSRKSRAGVEP